MRKAVDPTTFQRNVDYSVDQGTKKALDKDPTISVRA